MKKQYDETYERSGIDQLTCLIKLGPTKAKLVLWDIGGHVGFSDPTSEQFVRSAQAIIYCIDLPHEYHSHTPLEAIEERVAAFARPASDTCYVAVVGCKQDELSAEDAAKSSPYEGGRYPFASVSAKTNVGIDTTFVSVLRKCYQIHRKQLKVERDRQLQEERTRVFVLMSTCPLSFLIFVVP